MRSCACFSRLCYSALELSYVCLHTYLKNGILGASGSSGKAIFSCEVASTSSSVVLRKGQFRTSKRVALYSVIHVKVLREQPPDAVYEYMLLNMFVRRVDKQCVASLGDASRQVTNASACTQYKMTPIPNPCQLCVLVQERA